MTESLIPLQSFLKYFIPNVVNFCPTDKTLKEGCKSDKVLVEKTMVPSVCYKTSGPLKKESMQ